MYKITHIPEYYKVTHNAGDRYKVSFSPTYYKVAEGTTQDITVPVLQSAVIPADGLSVVLTYNEVLNESSVPAVGAFSLSGTSSVVNSVGVSGSVITLGVDTAIFDTDVVTLSYTAGANPIQDVAGNNAANLVGQGVTNNSTETESTIPRDGLIAEWLFSGNADDTSGNGYDGTLVNNPTLVADRFGNANSAYEFNGSNQYIGNISIPIPVEHTVSVWLSTTNVSVNQRPYSYGNTDPLGNLSALQTFLNGIVGFTQPPSNTAALTTSIPISNNTWYHVIFKISGTTLSVIVNNSVIQSVDIGARTWTTQLDVFDIARRVGGSLYWSGKLDDIRVYDRALTTEEITQLYEEGGYTP